MHTEWDLRNGSASTITADAASRWICPLTDTGILAIGGKDAGGFLQGQTTCDILGLESGQSTLGAICNPKGRVIALFRTFKSGDVHYLLLPLERVGTVQKRLRMFVLRADVEIEDVSAEWAVIGMAGEALVAALLPLGIAAPANPNGVAGGADCLALRVPSDSAERILIMARAEKSKALWTSLEKEAHFAPADRARWRLADIRAGIPHITPATSEEFVPQMLNLDLLGGISFEKGCYTGQEIVARTHYLGSLKRRLYRLETSSAQAPQAGDPIFEDGRDEQGAGQVVVSAPAPGGSHQMLAVLNIAQAESGILRLRSPGGPELSLLPLPARQAAPSSLNQEHAENGSEK